MKFRDLSGDQARQYLDSKQVFETWRAAAAQMWNGRGGKYTAHLHWEKRSNGREYLYQRKGRVRKSLGPRTPELERMYEAYVSERARLWARERSLRDELKRIAPVNRALLLGRLPIIVADILRKFDEHGFLGGKITVVGTNALYAYEAMCAVQLHGSVLATRDVDFLWDTGKKLELAVENLRAPSVIGLIRQVDKSFDAGAGYGYFARNNKGFEVELLMPAEEETDARPLGLSEDDLHATPYRGLQALQELPAMDAVVIDAAGMPVRMVVPEIRSFALHKEWVAARPDRKPAGRPRDHEQAKLLRQMCETNLGLGFDAPELREVSRWLEKAE